MLCHVNSFIDWLLNSHLEQLSAAGRTGDTSDGSGTPATAGLAMSSC